jgi:hypothetical protein
MEIVTLVAIFISGLLVSFMRTPYILLLGNPLNNYEIHSRNMETSWSNEPPNIGGLITSIEIIKNHFIFLVGTLGSSQKKIAKKIIPKVETKRNV